MSGIQISRSPDLERLEADGYRLLIVQGWAYHLLIDGIPAVTAKRSAVAAADHASGRPEPDSASATSASSRSAALAAPAAPPLISVLPAR
jgi:hypothetical protein